MYHRTICTSVWIVAAEIFVVMGFYYAVQAQASFEQIPGVVPEHSARPGFLLVVAAGLGAFAALSTWLAVRHIMKIYQAFVAAAEKTPGRRTSERGSRTVDVADSGRPVPRRSVSQHARGAALRSGSSK
jgi:hypothetical protein